MFSLNSAFFVQALAGSLGLATHIVLLEPVARLTSSEFNSWASSFLLPEVFMAMVSSTIYRQIVEGATVTGETNTRERKKPWSFTDRFMLGLMVMLLSAILSLIGTCVLESNSSSSFNLSRCLLYLALALNGFGRVWYHGCVFTLSSANGRPQPLANPIATFPPLLLAWGFWLVVRKDKESDSSGNSHSSHFDDDDILLCALGFGLNIFLILLSLFIYSRVLPRIAESESKRLRVVLWSLGHPRIRELGKTVENIETTLVQAESEYDNQDDISVGAPNFLELRPDSFESDENDNLFEPQEMTRALQDRTNLALNLPVQDSTMVLPMQETSASVLSLPSGISKLSSGIRTPILSSPTATIPGVIRSGNSSLARVFGPRMVPMSRGNSATLHENTRIDEFQLNLDPAFALGGTSDLPHRGSVLTIAPSDLGGMGHNESRGSLEELDEMGGPELPGSVNPTSSVTRSMSMKDDLRTTQAPVVYALGSLKIRKKVKRVTLDASTESGFIRAAFLPGPLRNALKGARPSNKGINKGNSNNTTQPRVNITNTEGATFDHPLVAVLLGQNSSNRESSGGSPSIQGSLRSNIHDSNRTIPAPPQDTANLIRGITVDTLPFSASGATIISSTQLETLVPGAVLTSPGPTHAATPVRSESTRSRHFRRKASSQALGGLNSWIALDGTSTVPPSPAGSTSPAGRSAVPTRGARVNTERLSVLEFVLGTSEGLNSGCLGGLNSGGLGGESLAQHVFRSQYGKTLDPESLPLKSLGRQQLLLSPQFSGGSPGNVFSPQVSANQILSPAMSTTMSVTFSPPVSKNRPQYTFSVPSSAVTVSAAVSSGTGFGSTNASANPNDSGGNYGSHSSGSAPGQQGSQQSFSPRQNTNLIMGKTPSSRSVGSRAGPATVGKTVSLRSTKFSPRSEEGGESNDEELEMEFLQDREMEFVYQESEKSNLRGALKRADRSRPSIESRVSIVEPQSTAPPGLKRGTLGSRLSLTSDNYKISNLNNSSGSPQFQPSVVGRKLSAGSVGDQPEGRTASNNRSMGPLQRRISGSTHSGALIMVTSSDAGPASASRRSSGGGYNVHYAVPLGARLSISQLTAIGEGVNESMRTLNQTLTVFNTSMRSNINTSMNRSGNNINSSMRSNISGKSQPSVGKSVNSSLSTAQQEDTNFDGTSPIIPTAVTNASPGSPVTVNASPGRGARLSTNTLNIPGRLDPIYSQSLEYGAQTSVTLSAGSKIYSFFKDLVFNTNLSEELGGYSSGNGADALRMATGVEQGVLLNAGLVISEANLLALGPTEGMISRLTGPVSGPSAAPSVTDTQATTIGPRGETREDIVRSLNSHNDTTTSATSSLKDRSSNIIMMRSVGIADCLAIGLKDETPNLSMISEFQNNSIRYGSVLQPVNDEGVTTGNGSPTNVNLPSLQELEESSDMRKGIPQLKPKRTSFATDAELATNIHLGLAAIQSESLSSAQVIDGPTNANEPLNCFDQNSLKVRGPAYDSASSPFGVDGLSPLVPIGSAVPSSYYNNSSQHSKMTTESEGSSLISVQVVPEGANQAIRVVNTSNTGGSSNEKASLPSNLTMNQNQKLNTAGNSTRNLSFQTLNSSLRPRVAFNMLNNSSTAFTNVSAGTESSKPVRFNPDDSQLSSLEELATLYQERGITTRICEAVLGDPEIVSAISGSLIGLFLVNLCVWSQYPATIGRQLESSRDSFPSILLAVTCFSVGNLLGRMNFVGLIESNYLVKVLILLVLSLFPLSYVLEYEPFGDDGFRFGFFFVIGVVYSYLLLSGQSVALEDLDLPGRLQAGPMLAVVQNLSMVLAAISACVYGVGVYGKD